MQKLGANLQDGQWEDVTVVIVGRNVTFVQVRKEVAVDMMASEAVSWDGWISFECSLWLSLSKFIWPRQGCRHGGADTRARTPWTITRRFRWRWWWAWVARSRAFTGVSPSKPSIWPETKHWQVYFPLRATVTLISHDCLVDLTLTLPHDALISHLRGCWQFLIGKYYIRSTVGAELLTLDSDAL